MLKKDERLKSKVERKGKLATPAVLGGFSFGATLPFYYPLSIPV